MKLEQRTFGAQRFDDPNEALPLAENGIPIFGGNLYAQALFDVDIGDWSLDGTLHVETGEPVTDWGFLNRRVK